MTAAPDFRYRNWNSFRAGKVMLQPLETSNHEQLTHQQVHVKRQKQYAEEKFAAGPRWRNLKNSATSFFVARWRLEEAMRRLLRADPGLSRESSVLVLCAGDGYEGIVLMDLGFTDVTLSDLSEAIVQTAVFEDARLKGRVLNAEETGLPARAFDIVLIQDGLHHLPRPVLGFTEMLRTASHAVVFLEPHNSLVGRVIGTEWETSGAAVNYVFRWTKRLVQEVASSYLGRDAFKNLSFSFWHHNPTLYRIGRLLGEGKFAIFCIRFAKGGLDHLLPGMGNQFCCIIVKNRAEEDSE